MASGEAVRNKVRAAYAEIAREAKSCCGPRAPSCCGSGDGSPDDLAQAIGYSPEDLAALPEGANLGLSCGNPVALASLEPGETVLDLGSGGGFDVFIAGRAVGASGRAIGIDMTPDMLTRARGNIASYRELTGLDNVEFRLGEIEHLPVADGAVDVILSNCVINLSPDKPQVWHEMFRVLKPGGRVAVSDLALRKPLPENVRDMLAALVGCIAGAALIDEIEAMAKAAGFTGIALTPKPGYIEAMTASNDGFYREVVAALPEGAKPGDYVVSLNVEARKPAESAARRAVTPTEERPA